jgi:hypothetical protein
VTSNDLRALLAEAQSGLMCDHYREAWERCDCAVCAVKTRIDAALAAEPAEDIPLRQENFALRAALAVRHNDEEWRLKYLASELKRGQAEKDCAEWQEAAQKVVDLFDPPKPKASPAVLHAVAQGAKVANQSLRERCRVAAQTLIEEVGADGPMNVDDAAKAAVERLRELRWDTAMRDALMESQERLALEVKGWKQSAEIQEQFKNSAIRERDELKAHIEKLNRMGEQLERATKSKP